MAKGNGLIVDVAANQAIATAAAPPKAATGLAADVAALRADFTQLMAVVGQLAQAQAQTAQVTAAPKGQAKAKPSATNYARMSAWVVAFGDADVKVMYVLGGDSFAVERVFLNVRGSRSDAKGADGRTGHTLADLRLQAPGGGVTFPTSAIAEVMAQIVARAAQTFGLTQA